MIQVWASAPSSPRPRPLELSLSVEIKKMQLEETWFKRFWCFLQRPKYLFQPWNKIWWEQADVAIGCVIALPSTKYAVRRLQSKVTGRREYMAQGDTAHSVHSAMLLTGNWAPVSRWPGNITTVCVVSPGQPIRDHNLTFRLQSGPAPGPDLTQADIGHYKHYITQSQHHRGNTNAAHRLGLLVARWWYFSCFWSSPNVRLNYDSIWALLCLFMHMDYWIDFEPFSSFRSNFLKKSLYPHGEKTTFSTQKLHFFKPRRSILIFECLNLLNHNFECHYISGSQVTGFKSQSICICGC